VGLQGIWGYKDKLWSAGKSGVILHYDPAVGSWVPQASGVGHSLQGIYGTNGQNIWSVGSSGTILHYLDSF
jgi:hypothetical protein